MNIPEHARKDLEDLAGECREIVRRANGSILEGSTAAVSQLTLAHLTSKNAVAVAQQRVAAVEPAVATMFQLRTIASDALWCAEILLKGEAASDWERKLGYRLAVRRLQRESDLASWAVERLERARAEILESEAE